MSGFLTAVIIISAIFIVIAVIMQPSKDGGLGGLASGGVTDSVFGTNRNEFLAKTTWWLLAIFLISSLVLAKHKTREHNEKEKEINTRSMAEEVSATKKADVNLEDAKENVDKALKEATDDLKKSENKTGNLVEEIKNDAVTVEEKVEKTVEEIKKEALKIEEKAEEVKPEAGK